MCFRSILPFRKKNDALWDGLNQFHKMQQLYSVLHDLGLGYIHIIHIQHLQVLVIILVILTVKDASISVWKIRKQKELLSCSFH